MEISPASAHELLQNGGTTLIDVRTDVEFAEQHAPGSRHIPLDRLPSGLSTLDPSRHYSLLCLSGKRASRAAEILSDHGFTRAAAITGGLENWKSAGLPCEQTPRRMLPLMRQVQLVVGILSLTASLLAIFIHPLFAIVPAFLGAGLTLAGSTGWCGLALLLARMPWNRGPNSAIQ